LGLYFSLANKRRRIKDNKETRTK